jgi:putative tryptophan/tyrosine transport system substrate-binding protein
VLEWRSAEGRAEIIDSVAAEVAGTKPDVIVAVVNPEIRAAQKATTTIPIVMVAATVPVEAGFADSMTRPGGNITGGAFYTPELYAKMLAVFKEGVPHIRRVALLPGLLPGFPLEFEALVAGAAKLGLVLRRVDVPHPDAVEAWGADSFFVNPVGAVAARRDLVLDFMVRHRLPALSGVRGLIEAGGLMAYIPNATEAVRRTARYVDRILKGAKPADLPLEQPATFELVLNLRTAKAIGLEFAPSFLALADELIE